ncbi:hypothetical protein D3C76_1646960 [compost metagenome]
MNMLKVTVKLETVFHLIIHILNTATLMNTTKCSIVTLKDISTQSTTIHLKAIKQSTTILMSTVILLTTILIVTQTMPTGTAMLTDIPMPTPRPTGKAC